METICVLCVKYLCCFADVSQWDALPWNLVKRKVIFCVQSIQIGLPTPLPGFLIVTILGKALVIDTC